MAYCETWIPLRFIQATNHGLREYFHNLEAWEREKAPQCSTATSPAEYFSNLGAWERSMFTAFARSALRVNFIS
jgi:hypothetical protein